MLKIATKLLLILGMSIALNATQELPKNELEKLENLELLKRAQIKVIKGFDNGSLYLLNIEVKGNADQVYLTKDKKFLIAGDVINTSTGERVSIPVDMTITKGKEAFTFGTGEDEFVLFTDPECPYCKKFESYFPQISDKVKIRVFYFPLSMHENAKDISLFNMSKKTLDEKIKAMMNTDKNSVDFKNRKYEKGELEKLEAHLQSQLDVAMKLNVQGTPAVFDKNGNKVSWVELLSKYGIQVK